MSRENVAKNKVAFGYKMIVSILVTLSVIVPILVISADVAYRQSGLPRVVNATLDLSSFHSYDSVVPLDGLWEFYWETWLVTDGADDAVPDALVSLPHSWEGLAIGEETLPAGGTASYRLLVENCPSDFSYIVRVPDSQTPYRVFMDGELVLSGGFLSRNLDKIEVRSEMKEKSVSESQPSTCEVVIEVASARTGGLYITPQLEENRNATVNPVLMAYLQAGVIVGLIVYIVVFSTIAVFRGSVFRADYFIVLCTILAFMASSRSEMMRLKVFKVVGAHFELVWLLQAIMLSLLPACLYLCARYLLDYRFSRKGVATLGALVVVMLAASIMASLSARVIAVVAFSIMCAILSLFVCVPVLARSWKRGDGDGLLFAGGSFVLISAVLVDAIYSAGLLVVNASCLLGVCSVLYASLMFVVFVRRMVAQERKAFELEQVRYQLKEAEVSLMLSQIRPHFLYNSLTAVMALIPTNPQLAQTALLKFSQYLRANIDAVTNIRMIPFERELSHIETYLDIEKLRFGDRLKVVIEADEVGFDVPQLSIQPLVENAVKHGICKKQGGGTVTLRTREDGNSWCVEVHDDGIGFDPSTLGNGEGGSIGIENVMYRLREECGAEIAFESKPGRGCTVKVFIPKGEHDAGEAVERADC